MTRYSLSSEPNFVISVNPEGPSYWIHFRYLRGLMYATIEDSSGNRISGPIRICQGQWLIPNAAHNFIGGGNFIVVDNQGQYPMFDRFSSNCELQYYTLSEIESGEIS